MVEKELIEFIFCLFLQQVERRNGWINVGDLQGAVHFKIVKYERIKFLVIALGKDSIEIYAWAPKPYHKFMSFKVSNKMSACKNSKWLIFVSNRKTQVYPLS